LAPVLAGLARSGADQAAARALERPRVQNAWVETTTATQRQLVMLLDDKTRFIQTEGGTVVLDLRPIMIDLGDEIVVIGRVAEKLPDSAGKIAIVDQSQLETAQTVTRILRAVADWMWIVALAVAALAVWLARGRRRVEIRALAIGVLVVGLLMLVVRRFAGDYLVERLAKDDAVKPAVQDAWDILTQVLSDRAWVWIILGLVTLVGVWFVGDTHRAVLARSAARPIVQNRLMTYAIAAVCLLLLALVAPAIATSWVMALLLIALVVVGIEVIRGTVQREEQQH
jgi:FtsH-binding integral membrane protein